MRAAYSLLRVGEKRLASVMQLQGQEPLSFLAHAVLVAPPARNLATDELNWVWSIEKESVDGPDNQQRN
jgi:hypothetical protein